MGSSSKNEKERGVLQPDAPKSSISPYELLSPNQNLSVGIFQKYGYTTIAAFGGGFAVYLRNFYSRRPLLSGFYLYPIAAAVAATAVNAFQKFRESQWAERDAIFRHYISLHPEDFPPYQRVKIADIFEPWTPIR